MATKEASRTRHKRSSFERRCLPRMIKMLFRDCSRTCFKELAEAWNHSRKNKAAHAGA